MVGNSVTATGFTAAQRAGIIQRVLVDGWSTAQAAKACGLEERQVARWVADYRRRGMASLRAEIAPERLYRRLLARARSMLTRGFGLAPPEDVLGTCLVLPRTQDDERRRR